MKTLQYLMESSRETDRLLKKTDFEKLRQQLILTGFNHLPSYARVCDIGSGVGVVGKEMMALGNSLGKNLHLTLVDMSSERLEVARKYVLSETKHTADTICTNVENLPLPSNNFDFVFSRFLFEYLPNQEIALKEILRVVRPGGKLVIGDLDLNCMIHYPLENSLQHRFDSIITQLRKSQLWDPFAGRKLFTYFTRNRLKDIKVHFSAHHLICGTISEVDLFNWSAKLKQIGELIEKKQIAIDFDFLSFSNDFTDFLKGTQSFSYTPLILVEGIKP